MRLRELLLLAKMRLEFCLEIFAIEDTTCFLTVPSYFGGVFEDICIFPGYVKPFWEGILLFVKVYGACPSCGRWAGIPPMRRFPSGFCVGKLKCFPLTKLIVPDLRKRKSEKIAKVVHSRFSPNRLLKVEGD
ncbi:hypothetical protein Tco_1487396, partial [Tanacetum coccineum]